MARQLEDAPSESSESSSPKRSRMSTFCTMAMASTAQVARGFQRSSARHSESSSSSSWWHISRYRSADASKNSAVRLPGVCRSTDHSSACLDSSGTSRQISGKRKYTRSSSPTALTISSRATYRP